MKEGWHTQNLGDLCDVLDHKRKPITKRDRLAGEYPYYGATGVLDHVEGYLFDEKLVLVGEDGAKWESGENTAFSVEGKYWVNNHAHVLRPHRTKLLDNWLIYYLNELDLTAFVSGLTVPKLNQGSLREIPIPLPPLPEQQRIVSILDKAFDGIATAKANSEKNLQNARALFESHLQSVFTQRGKGWVDAKLGSVCHKITDGTHITPTYTKEGVPFLSVKNLTQGFIDFSDTRFISVAEHEFLTRRCKPIRDDILYTKVGTTGIAQVVDVDNEFSIFVSVALLKPKHDIIFNLYLEHFLNAPYAREQAQKRTRGMANRNLVITDIKEIDVHFPKSLDEQRTIVAKLESLAAETQRLESLYERKLDALEELKKSLLHQTFSGRL